MSDSLRETMRQVLLTVPDPSCLLCMNSGCHFNHKIVDMHQIFEIRKKKVARDKRLIYSLILPSYQTMTQKLQNELDHIGKDYEEVVKAITKQGELKCSEIKNAVSNMEGRVETIRNQQIQTVQQHVIAI